MVNFTVIQYYKFKGLYTRFCPPLWSKWQHARLSRRGPGLNPRSGQVSWVRFFRGFSSPVRQMSGSFRPTRSPNIIWPSSSSFHLRLVGMTECVLGVYCLSCLCCFGGGPGIGLITHPGRPSMSLCGQKSTYVIHSLIPSPTGRSSVRPGRRGSRKSTYKGEVKLR